MVLGYLGYGGALVLRQVVLTHHLLTHHMVVEEVCEVAWAC
jgi:hypothetical protein